MPKYLPLLFACSPAFATLTTGASLDFSDSGGTVCQISATGTSLAVARIADIPGGCRTGLTGDGIATGAAAYGALSVSTDGWQLADHGNWGASASFSDVFTFQQDGFVRFRFVGEYSFFASWQGLISTQIQSGGFADNHVPVPPPAGPQSGRGFFAGSADYWTTPVQVTAGAPVTLSEFLSSGMVEWQGAITGSGRLILHDIEFTNAQGQIVAADYTSESGTDYAAIPEPGSLALLGLGLAGFALRMLTTS